MRHQPSPEQVKEYFRLGDDGGLYRIKRKGRGLDGARFGTPDGKYRSGRFNMMYMSEHELVYILAHGPIPEGHCIAFDTTHSDKPNKDNVESVPISVHRHRNGSYTNNRDQRDRWSQYRNVCYNVSRKKWISYINQDGKRTYLGYHQNEIDAAIAYNKKAIELYGENAALNIIEDEQ